MTGTDDRLRVTHLEHVALIELDGPRRNALDESLRRALTACYRGLQEDPTVRAIVLHGAGEFFSAGGDLQEVQAALDGEVDPDGVFGSVIDLFAAIERCPTPTVASVEGGAFGAGLELACATDVRIASPSAVFCASGVSMGLIAGQFRLPRLIGLGRAKEMLLTGSVYDAVWAREAGLLNAIADDPRRHALEVAGVIAARAPRSVQRAKMLAQASFSKDLDELDRENRDTVLELFRTRDHAEAVRAFLDKRPPEFDGR